MVCLPFTMDMLTCVFACSVFNQFISLYIMVMLCLCYYNRFHLSCPLNLLLANALSRHKLHDLLCHLQKTSLCLHAIQTLTSHESCATRYVMHIMWCRALNSFQKRKKKRKTQKLCKTARAWRPHREDLNPEPSGYMAVPYWSCIFQKKITILWELSYF